MAQQTSGRLYPAARAAGWASGTVAAGIDSSAFLCRTSIAAPTAASETATPVQASSTKPPTMLSSVAARTSPVPLGTKCSAAADARAAVAGSVAARRAG